LSQKNKKNLVFCILLQGPCSELTENFIGPLFPITQPSFDQIHPVSEKVYTIMSSSIITIPLWSLCRFVADNNSFSGGHIVISGCWLFGTLWYIGYECNVTHHELDDDNITSINTTMTWIRCRPAIPRGRHFQLWQLTVRLGSVVWLWQYQELFPAMTIWMTAFRMVDPSECPTRTREYNVSCHKCRVQKNPGFMKKPNLAGFIGFGVFLVFSCFFIWMTSARRCLRQIKMEMENDWLYFQW